MSNLSRYLGGNSTTQQVTLSPATRHSTVEVGATEIKPTPEFLREWFVQRDDVYALQNPNNKGYKRVDELLTDEVLQAHLEGNTSVGVYSTSSDNNVRWGCFDIDTLDTGPLYAILGGLKCPYIVERSGNKGRHVWFFLADPAPAAEVRRFGLSILANANVDCEFFPKQDTIGEGLGNLVKLPFGIHQTTQVRSKVEFGQWGKVYLDSLLSTVRHVPEVVKQKLKMQAKSSWISDLFDGVKEGEGRNNKMRQLIWWMQSRGFPGDVTMNTAEFINAHYMDPPLDGEEFELLTRDL